MKKLIVLTFVLVLTFIFAACCTASDRVSETFFKMFAGDSYHMKTKIVDGGEEITMETYVKKGMTATTTKTQGETVRMIMRDNKMYMIDDSEKTVMVMPASIQAQAGMGKTTAINTEKMRYVGSGTANFQGKNLPYDEYSIDGGSKSQFFVDGNKLAGIRNINGGNVTEVVILALDQNVPDNVFQIPAEYTQISF